MQISAEVHFAQHLASNQTSVREKALKKVGKWLERMSVAEDSLNEDTLLKIWKGIFYYYWHCDKMLVQEDRADVISRYIHNFKSIEYAFLYLDTFLQTMAKEWHGIDRYRIEKFMMLIRKVLHQSYQLLKTQKWNLQWIRHFTKILKKTVLHPSAESAPFGLKIHFSDIYMEELAKVGSDELTPKLLRRFLLPYCEVLCESDDPSFTSSVKKDVFMYLINQDADEAEYHHFPILKFNADTIQNLLMKYANMPDVRRKNMKVIHNIVKEFEDFKNGITLADKIFADQTSKRKLRKRAIEKASLTLFEEEQEYLKTKTAFKKKKNDDDIIDL